MGWVWDGKWSRQLYYILLQITIKLFLTERCTSKASRTGTVIGDKFFEGGISRKSSLHFKNVHFKNVLYMTITVEGQWDK